MSDPPGNDITRDRVPLLTVVTWVVATATVAAIAIWGWLMYANAVQDQRLENIESGRTVPMATTTKIELDNLKYRLKRLEDNEQCLRRPQ
jgi:hypothetical protein